MSRRLTSSETYKYLRRSFGPALKKLGFKRTKASVGWYREDDAGFLGLEFGTAWWCDYRGGGFWMAVTMATENDKWAKTKLSNSVVDMLSKSDQKIARKFENAVIKLRRLPEEGSYWYESQFMEGFRESCKTLPADEPVRNFSFITSEHIEEWSQFILERLPGMIEQTKEEWTKEHPDAKPQKLVEKDYRPWNEIIKEPDNDAARLVFADLLEEAGDPRAEFIRLQIELASMQTTDEGFSEKAQAMWKLHHEHYDQWMLQYSKLPIVDARFRRGFVGEVTITANQLVKSGKRIFDAFPLLERVNIQTGHTHIDQLAEVKFPKRITTVEFTKTRIVDADSFRDILASPGWKRLKDFRMVGRKSRCTEETLFVLFESPLITKLHNLSLSGTPLKGNVPDFVAAMEKNRLQSLTLAGTAINENTIHHITENKSFTKLKELKLNACSLKPKGLKILVNSPVLKTLEVLRLGSITGMNDKTFLPFADPKKLPALKMIRLWSSKVSDKTISEVRKRCLVDEESHWWLN